jgi:hypothetical protein
LHKTTVQKYGEGSDFIPKLCVKRHQHSLNDCIKTYLRDHPIFEFFAGIPLVISIVAPLSVFKSLSEIFLYLADKNERNFQSDVLKDRIDDESLIHCLEYCTEYFTSRKDSQILDLWSFIGMQGPGILYDDLKEVFGQEREEDKMDELLLD